MQKILIIKNGVVSVYTEPSRIILTDEHYEIIKLANDKYIED